jgi:hypothetical protein
MGGVIPDHEDLSPEIGNEALPVAARESGDLPHAPIACAPKLVDDVLGVAVGPRDRGRIGMAR